MSCLDDDDCLFGSDDDEEVEDEVGINEIAGPTPKLRASSSIGFLLSCSKASFSSWSRDFFDAEEDDDDPDRAWAAISANSA